MKSKELFRTVRKSLNKTQVQIAKELGISLSSVEKYESGSHDFPITILLKIINTYNLNFNISNNDGDTLIKID